MTPETYEQLVEDICSQIAESNNSKIFRKKKYLGSSGQEHEIDVSVEQNVRGAKVLFLIECKWWNKNVGVEQVLTLEGRLRDIGGHKGIIVTKTGFQKGAIQIARDRGIALVICANKKSFEFIAEKSSMHTSGSYNEVMQNIFEKNFSYYQVANDNKAKYTVFPILFDDMIK